MKTSSNAFEERLKAKDDEIIELRHQLNSIKLKSSFHSDNSSSSQSSIISSMQTQSEVSSCKKSLQLSEQVCFKSNAQSAKHTSVGSKPLDATHSLPVMLQKTPESLRKVQVRQIIQFIFLHIYFE